MMDLSRPEVDITITRFDDGFGFMNDEVSPLYNSIGFGIIGRNANMGNGIALHEFLKCTLDFTAIVSVNLGNDSIAANDFFPKEFGKAFCIGMSESTTFSSKREIVSSCHKIAVSTSLGHEHNINVNPHEEMWGWGNSERDFCLASATNLTLMARVNMMGNVLVHLWPIELLSNDLKNSIYSMMTKLLMSLIEDLST